MLEVMMNLGAISKEILFYRFKTPYIICVAKFLLKPQYCILCGHIGSVH